MTLLEEFNLRYPEFLVNPPVSTEDNPIPEIPEEVVQYWIDWAEDFLCPGQWGSNYRAAILALAAVRVSAWLQGQINGPGTAGVMGPVASASVGGESVGYGVRGRTNISFTEEWLKNYPPYGDEYLFLRNSSILGAATTRTGYCGDWIGKKGC